MTYWNPIEKYGAAKFAQAIADNGGSGVITPDLTIEESDDWRAAVKTSAINPIYVVAPSTKPERLVKVTDQCGGFIYAASLMGVTGARSGISSGAGELVARLRKVSDKPISVGLGVSNREQAKEVAAFADGVIVGSAFIKAIQDAPDEESGLAAVAHLASELAKGVREAR
jgi:tryptophan synthase alpha chain